MGNKGKLWSSLSSCNFVDNCVSKMFCYFALMWLKLELMAQAKILFILCQCG